MVNRNLRKTNIPKNYLSQNLLFLPSFAIMILQDGDTLSSLARKLLINSDMAVKIGKILDQNKFILREHSENNREKHIKLTKKGLILQEQMLKLVQCFNESLEKGDINEEIHVSQNM